MGIQDSGAFGGFRGKSGPLVGRRVMGKNVVSALPHPSLKPGTKPQIVQRQKLTMLTGVLSRLSPLFLVGYKAFTKKNIPFNAAYSYNYERVFKVVGNVVSLDFSRLVYSRGDVATPNCPSAMLVEEGGMPVGIAFSWLPEAESQFNRVTDLASFLVMTEDRGGFTFLKQGAAMRRELGHVVEIPGLRAGVKVHCYMCFGSGAGKRVGDSVWVGVVEM